MSAREWIFAALLAVAAVLVVTGVAQYDPRAGLVAAGVLLAGWAYWVVDDVASSGE